MKKNLLFALSVFAITISGLLVFCETSENSEKDIIETQTIQSEDDKTLADLQQ